jgi:hypothetical protein
MPGISNFIETWCIIVINAGIGLFFSISERDDPRYSLVIGEEKEVKDARVTKRLVRSGC